MIETLLSRLDGVKPRGSRKWMAKCPAHQDSDPSLSLTELKTGMILLHCHAGCSALDVVQSVGMELSDLYPDGALGEFKGWERLKSEVERRRAVKAGEQSFEAKTLAAIYEADAKRGERLSPQDIEKAKEAYRRANG